MKIIPNFNSDIYNTLELNFEKEISSVSFQNIEIRCNGIVLKTDCFLRQYHAFVSDKHIAITLFVDGNNSNAEKLVLQKGESLRFDIKNVERA